MNAADRIAEIRERLDKGAWTDGFIAHAPDDLTFLLEYVEELETFLFA